MSKLERRGAFAAALVGTMVLAALGLPQYARAGTVDRPEPTLAAPLDAVATASDVHGQNAMDHGRHSRAMERVALDNGLSPAPGDGLCGHWFQFRTATGLHCAKAPMLREMFTASQLADVASPPAFAADPKVTCIGTGTDGKRIELVYARRAGKADGFASASTQLKGWAAQIEQTMVLSAQKTGGVRKVRWVHDGSCVPTVLNKTVPDSVTSFSQLVAALESQGLTATNRKYLIAWDDGDATSSFCGLGQVIPDSTPGSSNANDAQPGGAMFAAVENQCWSGSVAAHEVMHTLGAVQDDAPHSSQYGHCTDESDIMCYVDGPGVVMTQTCPAAQEDLYDCNNDDYFNSNPPVGNYLKTHWNPASSSFLDATGSIGPPTSPGNPEISAGPGQVVVDWAAPAYNGGSAVLAYTVTLSPGGRTVSVAAPTTLVTITGLADGTEVTASIAASNKLGSGAEATTAPATPSPVVTTVATTPDGEYYGDLARGQSGAVYLAGQDRIERIDANGTKTIVVTGTFTGTIAENTLPLQTPVSPTALAVAANGDLYFFDQYTGKVRRLSGGRVNSVAGNGNGGSTGDGAAALSAAITVDALAINPVDGKVFFVDQSDHVVRRFTVGGTIATVAGTTGSSGFAGDGAAATGAKFQSPGDLAIDATGNVFVADTYNHRIRKFAVGGNIATVAGNGTTPIYPNTVLAATTTGVGYPSAIDWSSEKGLLIDTFGVERLLVGTNLVRLAGDLFDDQAVDVDGTPATTINFTKADNVRSVAWVGTTLHVLVYGPLPDGTGQQGKLRTAGPWSAAASSTAPAAPVVAPVAVAGVGSAKVSWVPASNGGSAITSYEVTATPGGSVTTAGAEATSVTVPGLTAGTSYTFTVAAVNGVGTGASSSASNAVTPTDAPPPPGYLPFASWGALVARQFTDLVNRPATAAEVSDWSAKLSAKTSTKGDLADALRRSPENVGNVDPVVRIYRAFLGRAPDAGGLKFWIGRKRAGTWTVSKISESFTASNEFKTKYGSLTNRQFVTRIYTDVLGRTADTAGVDYWTKKLDTKSKTKAQVMVGFSESNEYKTKQAQNTDVAVAYVYLMGRAPTTDEALDWVTREKAGTTNAALLLELLDSAKYAAHIGG